MEVFEGPEEELTEPGSSPKPPLPVEVEDVEAEVEVAACGEAALEAATAVEAGAVPTAAGWLDRASSATAMKPAPASAASAVFASAARCRAAWIRREGLLGCASAVMPPWQRTALKVDLRAAVSRLRAVGVDHPCRSRDGVVTRPLEASGPL